MWTFKLRKGVTFHDGKELTAADVVYSLNRHKDKAVGSRANALATQMEEIKATGTHEVKIKLAAPNADLPVILGTWHFFIIKDGTTDFKTAIGTGPYKVKEFTPGIRTVGVRNENYWKPGKPYLDEIELIGIPDEAARVNALHLRRRAADRRHQPALDPPDRGGARLQGVRDQGRLLHRPRHAPGRRSDQAIRTSCMA